MSRSAMRSDSCSGQPGYEAGRSRRVAESRRRGRHSGLSAETSKCCFNVVVLRDVTKLSTPESMQAVCGARLAAQRAGEGPDGRSMRRVE